MFNSLPTAPKAASRWRGRQRDGLTPAPGVKLRPAVDDLLRAVPRPAGGNLHHGQVADLEPERDGSPVFRDLRWGVYDLAAEANTRAAALRSTASYRSQRAVRGDALPCPDRPEQGISRRARSASGATGPAAVDERGARPRALAAGEVLDGEGGYTVWGKLMTAADSAAKRALPSGLAHKVKLKRAIAEGATVSWDDVEYDSSSQAVQVRREMEKAFEPQMNTDEHR
jgi:hypothetical protein